MRKIIIFAILAVIAFGIEGCEQRVKVLKTGESYIDKVYKFKVSPPNKSWSIAVMPRQKYKAQFISMRNSVDSFLNINISVKESRFSNLSDYADSIKKQINSFNPDSLDEKRAYLKGIEAYNVTSVFKSSYNIGCYFLNDGSQYSIVFSGSDSAQIEKYRKEFDEVLNSFEFVK